MAVVAVGYWRDDLDRGLAEISLCAATQLTALRGTRVLFQLIVGDPPAADRAVAGRRPLPAR